MGFEMRLLTLWVCREDFFFPWTWGATGEIASDIFSLTFINCIVQHLHQVKSDTQMAERREKQPHSLPSLKKKHP